MRTDIPQALQEHLDSGQTTTAYCWKITRKDGTVLGFTDHDNDLFFRSVSYEASSGVVSTELEKKTDMSVDNLEIMGALSSNSITDGDIKKGLYDNAQIDIYLVNWKDPENQNYLFQRGNLGNITRGETQYVAEFRGISTALQQVKGRIYSNNCDATFGDSRCKVNRSLYSNSGSVSSTDGFSSIYTSAGLNKNNGVFAKGTITFTSGNNNGITREIRSDSLTASARNISLWEPTPFEIQVGDIFEIVEGCKKTYLDDCVARFDNGVNFRGFPYTPPKDIVFKVAINNDPDNYDGGSLFS
jgi:uncharacterized phage protein (TIGR02218 family)